MKALQGLGCMIWTQLPIIGNQEIHAAGLNSHKVIKMDGRYTVERLTNPEKRLPPTAFYAHG
jgi:hypothetical protein